MSVGSRGLNVALLVHRHAQTNTEGQGWVREVGTRDPVPGETRPQDRECSWSNLVRWGGTEGRQHCLPEAQDRDSLGVRHPPRTGGTSLRLEVFGQTELENTKSRESSVRKGTQSKGNRPGAKGKGHQELEVTAFSRSRQP